MFRNNKVKNKIGNLVYYIDDDFFDCIYDILETPELESLEYLVQHKYSTRLEHCLNVAYYSYKMARALGYDYRSAARGGLLHDFYFYEGQGHNIPDKVEKHLRSHPKTALENANKIFELNDIEKDCILKHMWPITFMPPKYAESRIVCTMDKYCATLEAFGYESRKGNATRTMTAKYALAVKTFGALAFGAKI